jgi:hypothetical protein
LWTVLGALTVQGNGDVNGVLRLGKPFGGPCAYPFALGLEAQGGTNQDGQGWEFWTGFAAMFSIEVLYEYADREGFEKSRILIGGSFPGEFWDWPASVRVGTWFGDTVTAAESLDDEWGWYATLLVGRSARHQETGKYARKPVPYLWIEHDSFDGTTAQLVVAVPDRLRLRLGYSWMRWGDGCTAGVDWRF